MRQIEASLVRDDYLILLTARSLDANSQLMAADFRDMDALVFAQTGNWIGANASGLKLGSGPAEMIDGVWYVPEDRDANTRFQNIQLKPEILLLEIIK